MPRGPRLDYPGALHHVIIRGIERREIFHSDHDRVDFLDRLAALVLEGGAGLYAWALMPNHAHTLLRTGQAPLSHLMQRLLGGYARSFNTRHRRSGHLFQNRFKNTLVEEQPYLLELLRYIHLNPVRSRLPVTIETLDGYPWTGHATLLGYRPFPAQDTDFVLSQFGRTTKQARLAYRQFVIDGTTTEKVPDLDGGGLRRSAGGWELLGKLGRRREKWACDERILGSSDLVREVVSRLQPDTPPLPPPDPPALLAALTTRVASAQAVSEREIASSSLRRAAVDARALLSCAAVRLHGLTLTAIARHLGVSVPSIARAVARGQQLVDSGLCSLGDLHLD
jgi:putative transposase